MALSLCFVVLSIHGIVAVSLLPTPSNEAVTGSTTQQVAEHTLQSTMPTPRALMVPHNLSRLQEPALDDVTMEEEGITMSCAEGVVLTDNCEQKCVCKKGKVECTPRCAPPLVRSVMTPTDSHCYLTPTEDKCCSVLVCSSTDEAATCTYKNNTYKLGDNFFEGCENACVCEENGAVSCRARCQNYKNATSTDNCLSVTDSKDPCCTILYCDVNVGDDLDDGLGNPKLVSAVPSNSSSVTLNFENMSIVHQIDAEVSTDQKNWTSALTLGQTVLGLAPGKTYYFRVAKDNEISNVVSATLPKMTNNSACVYKDKQYKLSEEFYDDCHAYCACSEHGVECASIECPTDFGLDVLDPECLSWEPQPLNFTPTPPNCCPETVVCKNNGSCIYKGEMFDNLMDIPDKLTGCEQKCFCNSGNVTCRARCPPVPSTPPHSLPCMPNTAILSHPPGDDCCLSWLCPQSSGTGLTKTNQFKNDTAKTLIENPNSTPFLGPYNPDFNGSKNKFNNSDDHKKLNFPGPYKLHDTKTDTKPTEINNKPQIKNVTNENIKDKKINKKENYKPIEENEKILKDNKNYGPNKNNPLSGIFGVPVNNKPNKIPIGIINPDELNKISTPPPPHSVAPIKTGPVDNELLEHLLEYHHYQNKPSINNQDTYHRQPLPNRPEQEQILPFLRQPVPSKEIPPHYREPSKDIPPHYREPIPPKEIPPHYREPIPNTLPGQLPFLPGQIPQQNVYHVPNSQYVSPEELYYLENQQRMRQKQHQTFPNVPLKNHYHNPTSPIALEDIIHQIRQHEETDSRTKDTHVYVVASPNPGQAPAPPRPLPGFPAHPAHDPNAIVVHTLEAVDENNVRLIFSVPLVLVGLHGRVELRYTSEKENSDPSTWKQKVFAPINDLIATPELEFELGDLQPDTEYKIKITVVMRDLQNSPASKILIVKTPPAATTIPPMIPIEPQLTVTKVNSTWATLEWRKFNDFELNYIDGVQLRYKEINGKVYQATPLIHRAVTSYTLKDLKPESQYEIGIFFIPFPGQATELQAQKTIQLSTTIENDPYKFDLTLEVHHIKSSSVEISWSGVPYPEDKYVNIYRIIYQCEGGREDVSSFKVAKRDPPTSTPIQGLKPETRYRLWLEAYMTNGRIKKSNVKDFSTRIGPVPKGESMHDGLDGSSLPQRSDYYGALVGVSILAVLATMIALGLFVIVARKHGHNKAPITAAVQRKSIPHTAAYDNPSYKVEMQHETMGMQN